jgi:RNA polymerase sigma-70 factor, ECF subfamily
MQLALNTSLGTSLSTSITKPFSASNFSLDVFGIDFDSHRTAMLRFAKRKVRDEMLAEDAVQDALMAAVAGAESFQGQSAPRTWLMGILNHKIQDIFRKETRYIRIGDVSAGGQDEDSNYDEASTFDAISTADHGLDPMRALGSKRMGSRLAEAIDALPETLRDVVRMHLIEGLSTAEVCEALGISEANCWVRIHRARKKLATAMAEHVEPQLLS